MRLKFNYSFLLLEFKDLYSLIKKLEQKEGKEVISDTKKIIRYCIINAYLSNSLFYNGEETLTFNIRNLASKDIIPYDLMKYLLHYVQNLDNIKEEDLKTFDDFKVIYELIVWLVINCGEEDYSLFYDKLNNYEKNIFSKYLWKDEQESNFTTDNDTKENYFKENEDIEYISENDLEENENLISGELYYLGKNIEKDYFKAREHFKIAAEEGNKYAQGYLALFYEKGLGGEKDINQAIHWYKKAAIQGNVFSQYSLGYIYFTGNNTEKNLQCAFYWYKKAAENEFAPAQYALSYLYKTGEGCEKNIFKAYYWLQESAENEFEDSYYILGESYLEGSYLDVDYKKAFHYLSKGAEKNDKNCLDRIGDMYYCGLYVKEDREKAVNYYNKSIDAGNKDGYYKLGKLYEEEDNIKLAIEHYEKADKIGDIKATRKLGILYYNGIGVEKDTEKALDYIKLAADQDDVNALYIMGIHYLQEDRKMGLELLKKSYEKGSYYAAETLASEYLMDIFNEKEVDEEKLLEYIEMAIENNMEDAIYYKGLIYSYGVGVEQNNEEALKNFILAAENGSQKAMLKLGHWYKHGIFVKPNPKKAIQWYKKAAELKNTEALLNIIEMNEKGIGIKQNYHKAIQGAYLLKQIKPIDGYLKLSYYYIKGLGVEKSFETAQKFIDKALKLDEAKTLNFLGELAEEQIFNLDENEVIGYYMKAVEKGSSKAYSNLQYYLYKKGISLNDYNEFIGNIRNKSYFGEYGKSVYIKALKIFEEAKESEDSNLIYKSIKEFKKSIHLGFYDAIKDIIKYYESLEKNDNNLFEIYKYKQKLIYYNIASE